MPNDLEGAVKTLADCTRQPRRPRQSLSGCVSTAEATLTSPISKLLVPNFGIEGSTAGTTPVPKTSPTVSLFSLDPAFTLAAGRHGKKAPPVHNHPHTSSIIDRPISLTTDGTATIGLAGGASPALPPSMPRTDTTVPQNTLDARMEALQQEMVKVHAMFYKGDKHGTGSYTNWKIKLTITV
ncbi:unnamed protein product [Prunus armeniaca]